MQHANITIAYNNSIILCIAGFRSQLNAARTTRQRSARVFVGSVLVPRGLVCFVRSIIHVCTCTIQPTLFAAVGSAVLLGHGVLFHVQGLAVHPMLVSRTYFTLPHGFLAFHNVIHMDCLLSYLLHHFSYSNPFALLLFT